MVSPRYLAFNSRLLLEVLSVIFFLRPILENEYKSRTAASQNCYNAV